MTPAVERACETGKPVVVFDRGVETDCATTFIHPIGGFAWGIDTAEFLIGNLEEGDKVVALRILPGVDVLEQRWAAAENSVVTERATALTSIGSCASCKPPAPIFALAITQLAPMDTSSPRDTAPSKTQFTSMATSSPRSPEWISMKPPPPMFPARG